MTLKSFSISLNNSDSALIGDAIGGMTAPFIGIFGSVLVYIAFKAQYTANQDIKIQFQKQNDDQHFFRLIDSLDKRITLYTLKADDNETYSSYNILEYFYKKIVKNIDIEIVELGKNLFLKCPEILSNDDFDRLFIHFRDEEFSNIKSLKKTILNSNQSEREVIFDNIPLITYDQSKDLDKTLRSVAKINIYKSPKYIIIDYYFKCIDNIIKSHSNLFDGYMITFKLIISHIESNNDSAFYIEFIKGNLTTTEKIIIMMYVAVYERDSNFKEKILKYGILDSLSVIRALRPKSSTSEEYLSHIKKILE